MNFDMFAMNPMMTGKNTFTSDFTRRKQESENSSCPGDFLYRFEKAMKDHSLVSANGRSVMANIQEDSLKNKIDKLMADAKTPMEFVQALEQIMTLMSGGKLENLKIDPQGLAILKEILAGEGFEPDEVNEAFLQLSQTLNTRELPADKLLKALARVALKSNTPIQKQESSEQDLIFPESMVPVIQSILYELGVEKDVANHIMAEASIKGKGVQLQKLIDQLKILDEQHPRGFFQTPEGDNSFVFLIEQMGLAESIKGRGDGVSLSLNRLIHALEEVRETVLNGHNGLGDTKRLSDAKTLQKKIGKHERSLPQVLKEIFSMPAQADSDQILTDSASATEKRSFSHHNRKVLTDQSQPDQLKTVLQQASSDSQPEFSSLQEKTQKRSSYHHIKALTDQMEPTVGEESFDKKILIPSRKDLFNALAEHMEVEESASKEGMDISSEKLQNILIAGEKKHTNKVFSMDPSRKDLFNALAEHMKVEESASKEGMDISSEKLQNILIAGEKKHTNKVFSMDPSRGDALGKNDSGKTDFVLTPDQSPGAEGEKSKSSMGDMLFRKISLPEPKDRESGFSRDGDGIEPMASRKTADANPIKKSEFPSRPLPVHVTRQVGKGVLKAIQQGESTLRLQLKPASLGRLFITIDNLGDSMKVSVMTENQAARDMLNANANELKGILANTGINLAQFDVDMGSDFGQSMANTQQGSEGAGKRGNRSGHRASNGDGGPLLASESEGSGSEEMNSSLHYVA